MCQEEERRRTAMLLQLSFHDLALAADELARTARKIEAVYRDQVHRKTDDQNEVQK
jgi:hypothetical protein